MLLKEFLETQNKSNSFANTYSPQYGYAITNTSYLGISYSGGISSPTSTHYERRLDYYDDYTTYYDKKEDIPKDFMDLLVVDVFPYINKGRLLLHITVKLWFIK